MKKEIKASVHDIVDYVYAKGDIVSFMAQKNRMNEGNRIHRDIEKQYAYDKEVYVKLETQFNNYKVFLQGRIDLLDVQDIIPHVIEVKSTYTFDGLTEESYLAHFAQVKFYGYMLYHHKELERTSPIKISVMYVNKYTYEKKFFTKEYSYEALEKFFYETMEKYVVFQEMIDDFEEVKLQSLEHLEFPFKTFRRGQETLIDKVKEKIEDKENLFLCAPTGIGKSLGTIFPALQTMKQKQNKLFYLTSKSMIKDVARNAVNLMREHSDLRIKSLVITAKEKICINDCFQCNPQDCQYAKGFYNRLNEAQMDIYQNVDDFCFDTITTYAKKHTICPFEFQLALALNSDVIICDVNYVFDVRVYLRRFFDFNTSDFILLIDEAHNMYDRVCHMFTGSINFRILSNIINEVRNEKNIIKTAEQIFIKLKQYQNYLINEHKKAYKFTDLDEVLIDDIKILLNKLEQYFDKCREKEIEISETVITHYFDLNNFIKISEYYSDDFIVWVTIYKDECNYQITCLNPRELVLMRTNAVLSSIFFSATLHPMNYYMSLLGGTETTEYLTLDTPFNPNHLQLLVNTQISTKYRNREDTKFSLARLIEQFISNGGKYIIYFSSYRYLEMVYEEFIAINQMNTLIVKQDRNMTETQKQYFINQFDESSKNLVGFAVLGGIFAEGIDLQGEKLNGVCVIGVGLPMFNEFRDELKSYFDKKYKQGYQFAYTYPGFNKVLQAVGRVIRSEDDQGIALLIDERYLNYQYLNLYPKHWSHYRQISW